jgi:hypothetical protein
MFAHCAYTPSKMSKKKPRKKWTSYFSFANILSAVAIIISILAWFSADEGVKIQRSDYQSSHRPQLELRTYASHGTDDIFKGTVYEDTTCITGSYWITNQGNANLTVQKIELAPSLRLIRTYTYQDVEIPYNLNIGEHILATCSLVNTSFRIEETEEALKKYLIVTCRDNVGTVYIYEFIWRPNEGRFTGIPRTAN